MSEAKHTRENWQVMGPLGHAVLVSSNDGLGGYMPVAAVYRHEDMESRASLIAAAPKLLGAVVFVKKFLTDLENQSELGDQLRDIIRNFHAPLHEKLDAAIAKAEEQ